MDNKFKLILAKGIAALVLIAVVGIFAAYGSGADKARKQERDAAGQAGVGEYFVTKDGIEPVVGWRFKPHAPPVIVNEPVQMAAPKKAEVVAQRLFDAWEGK